MYRIKLRRDTAARWAQVNPVLASGEPGYDTDADRLKIGDGVSAWVDLPFLEGSSGGADLLAHVNDPTPHPIYDDGPSLLLLYENAKV